MIDQYFIILIHIIISLLYLYLVYMPLWALLWLIKNLNLKFEFG